MVVERKKPSMAGFLAMLIIGIVVCALSGAAGFWVIDREAPIVVVDTNVLPPPPQPGDTMKVAMTIYRKRSCSYSVTRRFTDAQGVRFALPQTDGPAIDTTGRDDFVTTLKIPDAAAPGIAHYKWLAAYRCNPIEYLWPIMVQGGYTFPIVPSTKAVSTSQSR